MTTQEKVTEMHDDPDWRLGRWDLAVYAVPGLPMIEKGDDIAALIHARAAASGLVLQDADVVVVAHKVISKAEGAVVRLAEVEPSPRAQELAAATGRDPRLCEVYIRESREILDVKGNMVITRHRLGFECTNAAVDRSNISPDGGPTVVLQSAGTAGPWSWPGSAPNRPLQVVGRPSRTQQPSPPA